MVAAARSLFAVFVLASACVSAAQAPECPYCLVSWACGVVVWPNRSPADNDLAKRFADRLGRAAEASFEFWECEPPRAPRDWEYPVVLRGRMETDSITGIRVVDGETGEEIVVPRLVWEDRGLDPVVAVVFRDEWRMRDALGATATFAAQFLFGGAYRAYPDAEEWIREAGRGRRSMITTSYADDATLVHELAHWFLVEWCDASGVEPWAVPNYIREGVAETTSADGSRPAYEAWERRAVLDWARSHCLAGGVGSASQYPVGRSLVTYLVGELGRAEFLRSLAAWATTSDASIARYESAWREWLELPAECGAETDLAR